MPTLTVPSAHVAQYISADYTWLSERTSFILSIIRSCTGPPPPKGGGRAAHPVPCNLYHAVFVVNLGIRQRLPERTMVISWTKTLVAGKVPICLPLETALYPSADWNTA